MPRLGTTTWKGRNYEKLESVKREASNMGVYRPVIIDFGPGGALEFLLDLLPEGNPAYMDCAQKLQRGCLKLAETALRKTGIFNLRTSEPEEIARVFGDLHPEKIHVLDKEPKVIYAVRRMAENASIPITGEVADIELGPLPRKGDIVIAYNALERTRRPYKSLENLADSVIAGGLLSTTLGNYVLDGFDCAGSGIYVKRR